jgi:hypothetical protein
MALKRIYLRKSNENTFEIIGMDKESGLKQFISRIWIQNSLEKPDPDPQHS